MLNDRENILSALREKPLKVREVMKRGNVVNEEAFSHVKDGETKSLPARPINGFHVTQGNADAVYRLLPAPDASGRR